jgi:lipoprotein-releasing system permease protein
LNFPYYFARRITFRNTRSVSRLVVILAVISISMGLAVMQIAIGVVHGFEREIRDKIIGFGSHVRVLPVGMQEGQGALLEVRPGTVDRLKSIPGVKSLAVITNGYGLLQSDETLEGVSLKGMESTEDMAFFAQALREGQVPMHADSTGLYDILISRKQADKLLLKTGDKARMYFLLDPPRIRPVRIAGIYETGLAEFDAVTVVCHSAFLRRIYDLEPYEAMMYEISIHDFSHLDEMTQYIREYSDFDQMAYSIREMHPEMFAWLGLQHQNVMFILVLMILIAVINMSSVLLILILERTRTIGVLKALGAGNKTLRNIFIWNGVFLVVRGVLIGNFMGLGVLYLQEVTGWMKLDQESYFLSEVPVAFVWDQFLLINVGLIVVCAVFLLLPARLIGSIRISESLRFD